MKPSHKVSKGTKASQTGSTFLVIRAFVSCGGKTC